jgi:uncharacterized protein (DUF1499 family)
MSGELNMKKFVKKLFGIKEPIVRTEEDARRAEEIGQLAADESKRIAEEKRIAALSPKEAATEKKEPYIMVLNTHVNMDNVRNGFFELDWNEYFVLQLKSAGYTGESDEAVVDQWFSELCRNVGAEEGVNMDRRGSGFISVNNLGNGKSEVS